MTSLRPSNDRKLLLWIVGSAIALIAGIVLLSPPEATDDPTPSITNHGPSGAKALFLTLNRLGFHAQNYDDPLNDLANVDAANTTLVLAAPRFAPIDQKRFAAAVERFLQRGGHVLATGAEGAQLLPGGHTKEPEKYQPELCYTTPEGPGPLANTGPVELYDYAHWDGDDLSVRTDQRCNADAVVVHFAVGQGSSPGEAIWWSSAHPLTNSGLKNDANLRLLLASLGASGQTPARKNILFDESLHGPTTTLWDMAAGLPTWWLLLHFAIVFLLVILSLGRRRGPIRTLVTRPRTSPLEFAESMGTLYARGRATSAATDAARSRLLRTLRFEVGLPASILEAGPEPIAEALTARLNGDWSSIAYNLQAAHEATQTYLNARSSLALVRALHHDQSKIRAAINPTQPPLVTEPSKT